MKECTKNRMWSISKLVLWLRRVREGGSGSTHPRFLQLLVFLHELHVIGHWFLLDQDLPVLLILLPVTRQRFCVVLRVSILKLIDDFLNKHRHTMFSLRMPLDSAFRSLAFSSRKVSLFEGMVFGMILMVFLMGSVSIFSILESRFSFCLTISFSTTLLCIMYTCDTCSIFWKGKKKVATVALFWCPAWSSWGFGCASGMRAP